MSQKSQNKVAESTSPWLNNICLFTFLAFITLLTAWAHFVILYLHLVDARFPQMFFVLSNICTLISFAPRTLQRPQENFCCLYSLFWQNPYSMACCAAQLYPLRGIEFMVRALISFWLKDLLYTCCIPLKNAINHSTKSYLTKSNICCICSLVIASVSRNEVLCICF